MRVLTPRAAVLGLAMALGPVACGGGGPASAPEPSVTRSAVIDGSPDPGDPAVGALWVIQATGEKQFCTGVLVGPQTFVTAAHCFAELVPAARAAVVFGDDAFAGFDGGGVRVDDFAIDPGFRDNTSPTLTHERDLGVAHLATPVGAPYAELNRYPVDRLGLLGKSVRLVGYGRTSISNNAAGPKVMATKKDYRVATDTELEAGAADGLACRGDSGAPAFFTAPDGSSVVVSIDSRGDTTCESTDISTRSDVELEVVRSFMSRHEDLPSCGPDGRCGFGCTRPDPDCPCAPDGFCTSACDAPESDPDCPQSCLFDGGVCGADPPPDTGCGSVHGTALAPWLALLWVLGATPSRARGAACRRPRPRGARASGCPPP